VARAYVHLKTEEKASRVIAVVVEPDLTNFSIAEASMGPGDQALP